MSNRHAIPSKVMLAAAVVSSLATSSPDNGPSSPALPTVTEHDAVAMQSTTTGAPGATGSGTTQGVLQTFGQPGAESVESALQIEWVPAGGSWTSDVDIFVQDTNSNRTWTASATPGSGPIFLEIDNAFLNCWGQGVVPSCDSAFIATVTADSGMTMTWDARLVGAPALADYQPSLIGAAE